MRIKITLTEADKSLFRDHKSHAGVEFVPDAIVACELFRVGLRQTMARAIPPTGFLQSTDVQIAAAGKKAAAKRKAKR